ncbi:MAG: helix-turn-helix domain-containing protein [Pseudomonadota bacterium]
MSRRKVVNFNFSKVFERVKMKTSIANLTQLAEVIEVSPAAVSKNKKENIFPLEWIYIIALKFNLELMWLITGEKNYQEGEIAHEKLEFPLLGEIEKWMKREQIKEPKFSDWFEVEFGKKFPEFAEWKRKVDKDREDSILQQANVA